MSIMECLEYSKEIDIIEGYEDLGCLGRDSKAAECALVFMARETYAPRKLPVVYVLSSTRIKNCNLVLIVMETLRKL